MKAHSIRLCILLGSLTLLAGCERDDNHKIKFGWVKPGVRLYYDFYSAADTIRDSRSLQVAVGRFSEKILNPDPKGYGRVLDLLDRDLVVKKGGLYGMACESCGMGIPSCGKRFEFLYAPNAPKPNQELPQYACSRNPGRINRIIQTQQVVTVPKGTYTTYVMLHHFGDKSYWNADEGLIMYEKYYNDSLQFTLKLNRIVSN
jgi:hypothetical protein